MKFKFPWLYRIHKSRLKCHKYYSLLYIEYLNFKLIQEIKAHG